MDADKELEAMKVCYEVCKDLPLDTLERVFNWVEQMASEHQKESTQEPGVSK